MHRSPRRWLAICGLMAACSSGPEMLLRIVPGPGVPSGLDRLMVTIARDGSVIDSQPVELPAGALPGTLAVGSRGATAGPVDVSVSAFVANVLAGRGSTAAELSVERPLPEFTVTLERIAADGGPTTGDAGPCLIQPPVCTAMQSWKEEPPLSFKLGGGVALSACDAVLTGFGGINNPSSRWNGSAWVPLTGRHTSHAAVAAYGADIYAGGQETLQRLEGPSWVHVGSAAEWFFHSLLVVGPGKLFVEGDHFTVRDGGVPPGDGVLAVNAGATALLPIPDAGLGPLSGGMAWASDLTNLWTVWGGKLNQWDGARWVPHSPGGAAATYAQVWGARASDVWVVQTGSDNVHRWTGSSWQIHTPAPGATAGPVWGSSASEVWVASYNGTTSTLHRWNGSGFTAFGLPFNGRVAVLTGSGSNVWATGSAGAAQFCDGAWRARPTPPGTLLVSEGRTWAIAAGTGDQTRIWHLE